MNINDAVSSNISINPHLEGEVSPQEHPNPVNSNSPVSQAITTSTPLSSPINSEPQFSKEHVSGFLKKINLDKKELYPYTLQELLILQCYKALEKEKNPSFERLEALFSAVAILNSPHHDTNSFKSFLDQLFPGENSTKRVLFLLGKCRHLFNHTIGTIHNDQEDPSIDSTLSFNLYEPLVSLMKIFSKTIVKETKLFINKIENSNKKYREQALY